MYIEPTLSKGSQLSAEDMPITTEDAYLVFSERSHKFVVLPSIEAVQAEVGENSTISINTSYSTDIEKTFIHFQSPQFYHFFVDFLLDVLHIASVRAEPHKIVLLSKPERLQKAYNFFAKSLRTILTRLGVEFEVLKHEENSDQITAYQLRNFYMYRGQQALTASQRYTLKDVNSLSNTLLEEFGSDTAPYRKVYISRSHIGGDERLDRSFQLQLEQYLRSEGYEIVVPEEDFTSIEDQIKYMSEVAILAAPSGSGLTNFLLMRDNQIVIELLTEMAKPVDTPHETYYVSWYNTLAFGKHHTYLSSMAHKDTETYKALISIASDL